MSNKLLRGPSSAGFNFLAAACFRLSNESMARCLTRTFYRLLQSSKYALTSVRKCYTDQFMLDIDSDDEIDPDDDLYRFVSPELASSIGHRVLLIQPAKFFSVGGVTDRDKVTEIAQLKALESAALVNSLSGWSVKEEIFANVKSNQGFVIGDRALEALKKKISSEPSISAVMISTNELKPSDHATLQNDFGLPVYDRYSIILQIFASRSRTKSSRLQVSLAEIAYLHSFLRQNISHNPKPLAIGNSQFVFGQKALDERRFVLKQRESRIKKAMAKLSSSRQLRLKSRTKNQIPTVAVVGYTNAGKTSLIKRLTEDERLEPQNVLFATLDLRVYAGKLNYIPKVLYLDTIGFITDIPDALIDSFRSTLEEINSADLVIHLQDITHPDFIGQCATVHQTLKHLKVPSKLTKSMIEVGNKYDAITPELMVRRHDSDFQISVTQNIHIDQLEREIERRLMINMGCFVSKVRIKTGSPEYTWLMRNAFILKCQVDTQDFNYSVVTLRFTEAVAGKYSKLFGTSSFIYEYDD